MRHDEVNAGQNKEYQVHVHEGGHVEGEVPFVGQGNAQSLGLLEVRDVAEDDDSLAENAERVQRDPNRVSQPGQDRDFRLEQLRQVVRVADYLNNAPDYEEIEDDRLRHHSRLVVDHREQNESPAGDLHERKGCSASGVPEEWMHDFQILNQLNKLVGVADSLVGARHRCGAVAIVANAHDDENVHEADELEQVVEHQVDFLEMLLAEAELFLLQLVVHVRVILQNISRLFFFVVVAVLRLPSIEVNFQPRRLLLLADLETNTG